MTPQLGVVWSFVKIIVVKFLLMWDFLVPPYHSPLSASGGEAVLVHDMKAYGEWRSSATHFDLCTKALLSCNVDATGSLH